MLSWPAGLAYQEFEAGQPITIAPPTASDLTPTTVQVVMVSASERSELEVDVAVFASLALVAQ